MAEPLPDVEYGVPAWVNYVNYWRSEDASWVVNRGILRFANATTRDSGLPSPLAGQVVYLSSTDGLQLRTGAGAWRDFKPLPTNVVVSQDDGTAVSLTHTSSAGKGVQIGAANVGINNDLIVQSGVLGVTASGVTVKTGAATAALTTNGTSLLSSIPVSVPNLTITGTGTGIDATGKNVTVGALTATSATITNIAMSGTLSGGGVVNGGSGTIGGVAMATNFATATSGYVSQAGYFHGDSTSALMRWRNTSGGGLTGTYIQVTQNNIVHQGSTDLYGTTTMRNSGTMQIANTGGSVVGYAGWVIVSGSDPGVGNYPDGSIWFQI